MIKEDVLNIAKSSNGIVTTKNLKEHSIPTIYLTRLEKEGKIFRVDKGIYLTEDGMYDEYYIFQYRYSKAIYSHVSALYLLNLTDKIPQYLEVSVPYSYKFNDKNTRLNVRYVKPDIYNLGVRDVKTMFGNNVRVYDAERTICDLILDRDKIESELYVSVIKAYIKDKNRDIKKLLNYAERMNILEKVRVLMEVYFE